MAELNTVDLEFVGKFRIDNKVENEMMSAFFGKHDGPFNIDEGEIEKIVFIEVETLRNDIEEMKMTPHCQNALKLVLDKYF